MYRRQLPARRTAPAASSHHCRQRPPGRRLSSTHCAAAGSPGGRSESPAQTASADNHPPPPRILAARLPDARARSASESAHSFSSRAARPRHQSRSCPAASRRESPRRSVPFFRRASPEPTRRRPRLPPRALRLAGCSASPAPGGPRPPPPAPGSCHSPRQFQGHGGSLPCALALREYPSAVLARDRPHDEQSQPRSLRLRERALRHPVKPPEDTFQLMLRNSHALIAHPQHQPLLIGSLQLHRHVYAIRRVLHRIVEQVRNRGPKLLLSLIQN